MRGFLAVHTPAPPTGATNRKEAKASPKLGSSVSKGD